MSPFLFPADQDLAPGDVSVASTIEPRHSGGDAKRIVRGLRDTYARRAGKGAQADVIVIAVPAGKGKPFLEGLQLGLQQAGKFAGREELPGTEGL